MTNSTRKSRFLPWMTPLIPLYWMGARVHRAIMRSQVRGLPEPRLPLVVIGALKAGGSGKTSVTLELARRFRLDGLRVAVLCYRLGPGRPGAADPDLQEVRPGDPWRLFSDEALLHAAQEGARVFATRDRSRAWRALDALPEGERFDIAISDDGFQDPRLSGAFRILLRAPGEDPGLLDLLPAGPFRETRSAAARADLVLEGPLDAPADARSGIIPVTPPGIPGSAFARRVLLPPGLDRRRAWPVLCGLADNAAFLSSLERAGLRPGPVLSLRDHAAPGPERLAAFVRACGGPGILCTRKDAARLAPEEAARLGIRVVDQEILLGDGAWEALRSWSLGRRSGKGKLVH